MLRASLSGTSGLLRYMHVFTVLFVVYWYICYSVLGSVDRSMASSSGRVASTPNNTQTRNQTVLVIGQMFFCEETARIRHCC